MIQFKFNDGGSVAEKRDCCVRAFAILRGIPYAESHALFAAHGRKPGHSTTAAVIHAVLKESGLCWHRHFTSPTLNQFLHKHPTFTGQVHVRGHAFAVVKGVVNDIMPVGSRCRVYEYWTRKETNHVDL